VCDLATEPSAKIGHLIYNVRCKSCLGFTSSPRLPYKPHLYNQARRFHTIRGSGNSVTVRTCSSGCRCRYRASQMIGDTKMLETVRVCSGHRVNEDPFDICVGFILSRADLIIGNELICFFGSILPYKSASNANLREPSGKRGCD
jgi:hypothetical protein